MINVNRAFFIPFSQKAAFLHTLAYELREDWGFELPPPTISAPLPPVTNAGSDSNRRSAPVVLSAPPIGQRPISAGSSRAILLFAVRCSTQERRPPRSHYPQLQPRVQPQMPPSSTILFPKSPLRKESNCSPPSLRILRSV